MANIVKPIPNWDKKQNACWFCKSNKSVKYALSCLGQEFPICITCMLKLATILAEGKNTNT